ncbi:hypothetical protein GCM10010191_35630 [Actinomadura vinacea]|uniref:DUF4245 domain-containing protein n=1 Tax=Actinomadura vinacea TaxID=115336 RepID=A0ABP5W6L1_9ACTN
MRPGRPRSLAAALAAALLVAGCGGGSSDRARKPDTPKAAPVPYGYTPVRAGRVMFAHPAGWKAMARPPQGWLYGADLRGGDGTEVRAGVIGKVPQVPAAALVADAASSGVELNAVGVQRGANRTLKIPGAREAVRVDYTYATREGRTPDHRGTDVSVVWGAGSAAVVRITGPQAGLTPAQIDPIVRTIGIGP